jgi:hypothetical protein
MSKCGFLGWVALLAFAGCAGAGTMPAPDVGFTPLFDGATLTGWEGSADYFRVEDGVIVGGTDAAPIPRNEFLCRREVVGDFELRLRFRLEEGVNSGVQFRSQRIPDSHETIGYQADLGEGYWGALYDESRRNRVLAAPEPSVVEEALDRDGWNHYRVLAEGSRIRIWINDRQTVDYTEPDEEIAATGRTCLQIHSGPPGEVRFMDVQAREL